MNLGESVRRLLDQQLVAVVDQFGDRHRTAAPVGQGPLDHDRGGPLDRDVEAAGRDVPLVFPVGGDIRAFNPTSHTLEIDQNDIKRPERAQRFARMDVGKFEIVEVVPYLSSKIWLATASKRSLPVPVTSAASSAPRFARLT